MATSGTTVYARTARDIITDAMRAISVLAIGATPTSAESANGIVVLNDILNAWSIRGVSLSKNDIVTVTVTAAKTTLSVAIRDIVGARVDVAGNERPLSAFTRWEYLDIPAKSQAGTPSCFYVDQQRDAVDLYVWPVPTSATINLDADMRVETITDESQTVDIRQEYLPALQAALEVRLALAHGQPIDPMRAAILERQMFDDDREASVLMGVV
jgi:hypothetical protein